MLRRVNRASAVRLPARCSCGIVRAIIRRIDNMDINLIAQPQRFAFRNIFAHAFDHIIAHQLVRA